MSFQYEPASEPLHISVKLLFLNWELYRSPLRGEGPLKGYAVSIARTSGQKRVLLSSYTSILGDI